MLQKQRQGDEWKKRQKDNDEEKDGGSNGQEQGEMKGE